MSSKKNLLAVYDIREPWKPYHEQILRRLSDIYRVRLCLLEHEETGNHCFSIDRESTDIEFWLRETDVVLFFTLSCETMEKAMKMNMTDPYAELILTVLHEGKKALVLQHWLSDGEHISGIRAALTYWRDCVKRLGFTMVCSRETELFPVKEEMWDCGKTRWLTEEDICRWAAENPARILELRADEKMTPLAADRAKELSVEIRCQGNEE